MTIGFFQIFKIGFNLRLIIYGLVVFSASVVNVVAEPFLKLLLIVLLVASSEAAVFIFTKAAFENIGMLIFNRGIVQPMPVEIQDLANRMDVKVKTFKIVHNFRNAFTNGNNIVIGQTLIDELTKDELLAVIAHELAHIKENHIFLRIFVLIPVYFIATLSFQGIPEFLHVIAVFTYVMVVLTPLNWHLEVRADRLARKYVGSEAMKSALTVLTGESRMKEASETHPPTIQRIQSLNKE